MKMETKMDNIDASFDIVARQDAADTAIEGLRKDVDEVKSRLDKVSRAAARPIITGTGAEGEMAPTPEMKRSEEHTSELQSHS